VLIARNLTDTWTPKTLSLGSRSGSHNNPSQTWTDGTAEPALAQQQSSLEDIDNRDVTVSRRLLFLGPSSTITFDQRGVLGSLPGVVWRVVGDPAVQTALGGRPSHVEAIVEKVTG
jgi:hypothetical protein